MYTSIWEILLTAIVLTVAMLQRSPIYLNFICVCVDTICEQVNNHRRHTHTPTRFVLNIEIGVIEYWSFAICTLHRYGNGIRLNVARFSGKRGRRPTQHIHYYKWKIIFSGDRRVGFSATIMTIYIHNTVDYYYYYFECVLLFSEIPFIPSSTYLGASLCFELRLWDKNLFNSTS